MIDERLKFNKDNIFRYYRPEYTPDVEPGTIEFKTASEIEFIRALAKIRLNSDY